jgi:Glyoxalase-like domain
VRSAGIDIQTPTPGSRRAPDGTILAWQSAAVDQLGVTPFFIEWSEDTPHPSTTSPSGCTLVTMELEHPAPERLQTLFKTIGFPAPISKAERSGMKVTLDCPHGRVEFRS